MKRKISMNAIHGMGWRLFSLFRETTNKASNVIQQLLTLVMVVNSKTSIGFHAARL